jgi:hypothetical protein
MLTLDEFVPIELDDKEFFDKFYKEFPPLHSDYSFTTMVCWHNYMKYFYAKVDGSIVIMTRSKDKTQFRPALGRPNREICEQVLRVAKANDAQATIGMVDTDAKARLSEFFPGLVFEPDTDYFDYVYLATDLSGLAGKNYLKIRNLLNRFKKRYDFEVAPIKNDNLDEVTEFLMRWCHWKDCDKVPLLASERDAIEYCMEHFFELNVSGIIIKIDDVIEAVSIFEPMSPSTAVIHFEKAMPDFDGLYQAINQEAAKVLVEKFKYINREADMGFPGLRLAKKKYHPDHMVEIYHVKYEELKKII